MKNQRNRLIAILSAVALLSACASVDVTKTSKGFRAATEASSVEILKTVPAKAYEELGTVTVTGFSADESAKMHNAIRTKASALGANAVLLTDEGIIKDGWTLQRWATGVAIAYAVPSSAEPVVAPVQAKPPTAPAAAAPAVPPSATPVLAAPAPAAPVPVVAAAAASATPMKPLVPTGGESFQVQKMAKASACAVDPLATLTGKGPGFENYSVTCADGDVRVYRCEFGNCRVLK